MYRTRSFLYRDTTQILEFRQIDADFTGIIYFEDDKPPTLSRCKIPFEEVYDQIIEALLTGQKQGISRVTWRRWLLEVENGALERDI